MKRHQYPDPDEERNAKDQCEALGGLFFYVALAFGGLYFLNWIIGGVWEFVEPIYLSAVEWRDQIAAWFDGGH